MFKRAQTILKNVFGYEIFRPLQAEVIQSILARKDTLVIMPTGGGKSLCYQIPSLLFSGLTVVVSPLIALMKDQVDQMQRAGVAAVMLNSALNTADYRRNIGQIRSGAARLLYLAPETLMMKRTVDLLSGIGMDCLAIDEAHCISEWGHDFRPEYRQLVQIRQMFPGAVCTALTATATPRVRRDIQATLGFRHADTFIGSFNRDNLFLRVVPKTAPLNRIRQMIKKYPDQAGIIYCATRRQVDELALSLQQAGQAALPYHAGLPDEKRRENQERFIRDDIRIIVATIAFGMGIDKPDIRFVIHYDMPKNIESYYQEIGRAGRDGLPADCLLLFNYADLYKIKHFIQQKTGDERRVATIHLNAFLRFAEWPGCRRIPLLQYFGEAVDSDHCGQCDNCRADKKEKTDLTIFAQKFLSCVFRTGERFGATHIINVLRGSRAQRVIQFNHHKLSTYGIGRDLSRKQWQMLSRQFLHQDLLSEDMEYGGLRLGPGAWDVLKSKTRIQGWLGDDRPDPLETKTSARSGKAARPKHDADFDPALFQRLRARRKEIADRDNIPPYVIFSDRTLMEMAAYFPQTEAGLYQIHGVGEAKLTTFGPMFLDEIQTYCRQKGIAEKAKPIAKPVRKSAPSRRKSVKKKRHEIIGETFNAGRTVEELMAMFLAKRKTVLDHLYRYWKEGHSLASDQLGMGLPVSEEQLTRIFSAFDRHGIQRLKPAYDAMAGAIDYTDLTELRLKFIVDNHLMATGEATP